MELLVNQLEDRDRTIALTALDILEEAIHDKVQDHSFSSYADDGKLKSFLESCIMFSIFSVDVPGVVDCASTDIESLGRSRPFAPRLLSLPSLGLQVPPRGQLSTQRDSEMEEKL